VGTYINRATDLKREVAYAFYEPIWLDRASVGALHETKWLGRKEVGPYMKV
jgi:hypothetical protein